MTEVWDQDGVRLGVAGGLAYVAMGVLVTAHVSAPAGVAVLLTVTALSSLALSRPAALLLGASGWALATGFLVNGLGALTFAADDLVRLGVYLSTAIVLAGRWAGGE
jgi:hypothetical protein